MDDIKQSITAMFRTVRQCYADRDPGNIDPLCGLLFSAPDLPVVIGTSNSEWCLTTDEIRGLFLSDWEGWGNVTVDLASLVCGEAGALSWFSVKAGVEFCFEDSEQRYGSYMASAQRIARGKGTAAARAGHILWLLSHLLHMREPGKRRYIWDLTISGILKDGNNGPKIQEMQFSLPVTAAFPDVRIDLDDEDQQRFEEECGKVAGRAARCGADTAELRRRLCGLLCECNAAEWDCGMGKGFFTADGLAMDGAEFREYLQGMQLNGLSAELVPAAVIAERAGDSFWFCGLGTVTRPVSLEAELAKVLDQIDGYGDQPDRKKTLFRLRRDLALAMKEAAASDRHVAPFRIEGVGQLGETGSLRMEYARITYPFNWILEQKTDAQREIADS